MMNNLNFVIKAVEGSQELGGLGVDWVDLNRPLVSTPSSHAAQPGQYLLQAACVPVLQ